LDQGQLDTPYRPGGWTVRQLVHHVADSHLNSYVRFKWATTEDRPTIKAYDEAAWAELSEARSAPIEMSLVLLEALHDRWTLWLRSFTEDHWATVLVHPETGDELSLDTMLQLYQWHGKHHVAHVTQLRSREGW
jgi:DinB superfamily